MRAGKDETKQNPTHAVVASALMTVLALVAAPFFAVPASAQANPAPGLNQAFLYEMSEDAILTNYLGHQLVPDPTGKSPTGLIDSVTGDVTLPGVFPTSRNAVSALQGYAAYPSPLCPASALVTNPKSDTCTVTSTGYDNVTLVPDPKTGAPTPTTGAVWGTFAIVIQLDNPTDSPEWPLVPGSFYGQISFGNGATPIGAATGSFLIGITPPANVAQSDPAAFGAWFSATCQYVGSTYCLPFTSKFRQPFAKADKGGHRKARRGEDAFYLLDNGKLQHVRDDERAVGWPTVRFEVTF